MPTLRIIMILLLGFIATAHANEKVAETLGVPAGEYELQQGDRGCSSGDLHYADSALVLGARPLAVKVDSENSKEKDRDCVFTITNKLTKGSLEHVTVDECKNAPKRVRRMSLKKTEAGFKYSLTLEDANGKIESRMSCTLALVK